jgi:hypothetical protein
MINVKGCERERSWPNLNYYPGSCLEGLRKSTKTLSLDSRSPGRDLNLGPPEYEAAVLTTRPRRSVIGIAIGFSATFWVFYIFLLGAYLTL